ncbi:MAG: NADP-dependent isocitrate dehydrogenase [Chlamydiales bacterium]
MEKTIPIAYAEGDGIGPEIMQATLSILKASNVPIEFHQVEIGEKVYQKGVLTGIEPETWEVLRNCKAFLKAPITTPQGGGFKSLNVTIRTTMGQYANVRRCVAYHPFIETKHPGMDVVIVRENEEDLYAGIEYRQSPHVYHALKIITREGCEKIIRYAFEYAIANNRKKVTCFTKDNILKMTDGLFHKVFEEIAQEYPNIESEHWIIDIGAAKLADTPAAFDVMVMANLYGDILSDVAAQIAGSVGLAGSSNIGEHGAMFEAIHGSAPRRAGQNVANPSGLLLAAVQMLVHVGLAEYAERVHNAWMKTIEDGIHTYDIYDETRSLQKVGTREFAEAVIERLGQTPEKLKAAHYSPMPKHQSKNSHRPKEPHKTLVGVDVYVEHHADVLTLVEKLQKLVESPFSLEKVYNRGVVVWPDTNPETTCVEQWRCRFRGKDLTHKHIVSLLEQFVREGMDFLHIENLYTFQNNHH